MAATKQKQTLPPEEGQQRTVLERQTQIHTARERQPNTEVAVPLRCLMNSEHQCKKLVKTFLLQ